MKHKHLHTHDRDHPHAFGFTVAVRHDHEHAHADGTLMATFGEGSHHRPHKHTADQDLDLRKQAAR